MIFKLIQCIMVKELFYKFKIDRKSNEEATASGSTIFKIGDFNLNKSTANATDYDRHDKTIILSPKRGMTDSKFDEIPGKTNLVCDT